MSFAEKYLYTSYNNKIGRYTEIFSRAVSSELSLFYISGKGIILFTWPTKKIRLQDSTASDTVFHRVDYCNFISLSRTKTNTVQNVKFSPARENFFQCGEYVIGQFAKVVIIVKQQRLPDSFSGTIVASEDPDFKVGSYMNNFVPSCFKKYKGTITVG